MPHPAPQRDRTTIAMIMRGNRSATDNIWPEAARGHLARGRISGQRPCDRPRTVSSKARGPTKESKQRQGPSLIVNFVSDYWILQLIVLRVTDFFLDPCCWRGAQAQTDHLHEEPFFPLGVAEIGRVIDGFAPTATHAPPLFVQAWGSAMRASSHITSTSSSWMSGYALSSSRAKSWALRGLWTVLPTHHSSELGIGFHLPLFANGLVMLGPPLPHLRSAQHNEQ
mgnify:CR=1 FL=1